MQVVHICIAFLMVYIGGVWSHSPASPAPQFTIDLDSDPLSRWTPIVSQFKDQYGSILAYINRIIPPSIQPVVDMILGDLDKYIPSPYGDELRSVAAANIPGIDLGKVVLLNLLYDITAFGCTSIVAQNQNGTIFHGRNLDYGIDSLQNITIQVNFQRKGVTLYSGTHFAGYVGILSGSRPGGWSVTVNQRNEGKFEENLYEMLNGGQSIGFFLRSTLETNTTFYDALETLQHTPLIAAVYLTAAGIKEGEAVIITRDRADPADVWFIIPPVWYVLETNDDHWKPPADGRRDAANKGMSKLSVATVTLDGIYSVLSTPPVFNGITRYTALMCAATGQFTTYVRWDSE